MVEISLECAIAGQAGTFDVTIQDGMKVSALRKAVKVQSEGVIKAPSLKLRLFLAKKENGAWLDGAGVAAVTVDERGNPRGFEQMDPLLWLKNANYFGENFTPGEGQVHVLVVVPEVEPERPVSAKAQRKKLLNALEWREPKRLCTGYGQDWTYQGALELVTELARPLVTHYEAWKLGYEDKQNHAINLVVGGRGTGKSRMLDEMKGLLCEAAKQ